MPKMPVRIVLSIIRTPALRRVRLLLYWHENVAVRRGDSGPGRAKRWTVELEPYLADVVVEERPVRAKGAEPQVVLSQRFDDPVDLDLAVVEFCGQGPEVLENALQRPPRLPQHVGQIVLRGGQRWKGSGDRVTALCQSADQLLELVDARVELRALGVDGPEHVVEIVDQLGDDLVQ